MNRENIIIFTDERNDMCHTCNDGYEINIFEDIECSITKEVFPNKCPKGKFDGVIRRPAKSKSIVDINHYNENRGIYSPLIEHNNIICGYWLSGNDYKNKTSYYGTYPPNYLKRIRLLFSNYDDYKVLHIFSGVVDKQENEITFDINDKLNPDVVGNAEELSLIFKDKKIDIILADPPYTPADSEKYGCKHPNKKKVLQECARTLRTGGILVWLDLSIPMWAKADGWKLRGTIGFNQSTNHKTRTVTILEKTDNVTR